MTIPPHDPFTRIENTQLRQLLYGDGPFPFDFAQQPSIPVFAVEEVDLRELNLNGKRLLLITAFGTVATGGWSLGRLQPYVYVQAPEDGIWDFVFTATPPAGPAPDVVTPITASATWTNPISVNGVRIHAATNYKEATPGEPKSARPMISTHKMWEKIAA